MNSSFTTYRGSIKFNSDISSDLKRKKKIHTLSKKRRRLRKYGVNCTLYCTQIVCGQSVCSNPADYSSALISPASSISDEFDRRFDFVDREQSPDEVVDFAPISSAFGFVDFSLVQETPPESPLVVCETEYDPAEDVIRANTTWDLRTQLWSSTARIAKRVSFSCPLSFTVAIEDSSENRKGCWEMLTRDSERFRRRIYQLSETLSSVLSPAHRKSIYIRRFEYNDEMPSTS